MKTTRKKATTPKVSLRVTCHCLSDSLSPMAPQGARRDEHCILKARSEFFGTDSGCCGPSLLAFFLIKARQQVPGLGHERIFFHAFFEVVLGIGPASERDLNLAAQCQRFGG